MMNVEGVPMTEPPRKRRATYQDVLDAPEGMTAEILEGELVLSPQPATPHAFTGTRMPADILGHYDGPPDGPARPGGWWFLHVPELHLGDDVVVPDLAGWRRERMRSLPNAPYIAQAPDWVCEIVSPSPRARRRDRLVKKRIYAREGVRHYWLVEPIERIVEVLRLEEGGWKLIASAGHPEPTARLEPFDAVELPIARWWLDTGEEDS